MTHTEFDKLRAKLAAIPSTDLANFIADIAVSSDRVNDAAHIFSERKNPSKLAKVLRKQLQALENNDHFYHYREAPHFVKRMQDWLNRLEQDLIPQDPLAAIDLLGKFFKADQKILEHVDDSDGGVGDCYFQAAKMMATASIKAGPTSQAGNWIRELMESNEYGVRDHLYDRVADFLSASEIRALIENWRIELANETSDDEIDYRRHSIRVRCKQFAKAIPDPELFADIALEGQSVNELPIIAISVAQLFLDAGQPERAKEFLPEPSKGHWNHQMEELKIAIHEALGETEAAQKIRWAHFCEYPSGFSSEKYLKSLPHAEHATALKQMRAVVDEGQYNWQIKARYYLDHNDNYAAASVIELHHEEARRGDYYKQSEMAKTLADSHPLAATILLRGAAEQTVAQSISKYYSHAVRYILKLERMTKRIEDWGNLESHTDWYAAFIEQHRRKTALISKLKKAGIETG